MKKNPDHTKHLSESLVFLLELPPGIVKQIMEYLDNNSIRSLAMGSKDLYDMVAFHYFNTLHATGLRFLAQQKSHLSLLESKFKSHENSYTVSLRRPWNASLSGALQLGSVAIYFTIAGVLLYRYGYKYIGKVSVANTSVMIVIALAIATAAYIRYSSFLSPDETALRQGQLFNAQDAACLRRLCAELINVIPHDNLLTRFVATFPRRLPPNRTVRASLNVCNDEISHYKGYLSELENFIRSIRLMNVKEVQIRTFSPDFRSQLTHSVRFWNKNRTTDRIVLDIDQNNSGHDVGITKPLT